MCYMPAVTCTVLLEQHLQEDFMPQQAFDTLHTWQLSG